MTRISTTSRSDDFSIELISPGVGRIVVGGFGETFPIDLTYWNSSHYEQSWSSALNRLEGGDVATSCLVSSLSDPVTANFISCWPLYRIGDDVFVQNSLVFLAELSEPFDPEQPWLSIGPREVVDEGGNEISEWRVDVEAVRRFRSAAGANGI
ncbi:hypothetical protein OIB37_00435 [Streptomyces sp. NBC_00820]|uniref:hypothetical protein n=1 Tax=Streptomyces sp. NBC_00820 TaxID=2975842 RepID=UPI002ED3D557|nr:hypothetical protein OIB37_00435 [Streptomyces sp. NBC_00820]